MKDRSRKLLILAVVSAVLVVIDVALCFRVFRPRLLDPDLYAAVSDSPAPFTSDRYAAVLDRYVDAQGLVNYKVLKDNTHDLNGFLRAVACLDPKTYDAWPEREKIAFWVNVYNAMTLRVILDHYPIRPSGLRRLTYPPDSIRQIPGVWTRLRFVVMGKEVTLDEVEHKRLREAFNEPRIHVALVCAAMSCPLLRQEPYQGDMLDEQLDDQARRFLLGPGNFRIDRKARKVYLSSIFQWFGGDFVKTYAPEGPFGYHGLDVSAVLNFAAGYLEKPDADYLRSGAYTVEYTSYDWALNRQPLPPATAPARG